MRIFWTKAVKTVSASGALPPDPTLSLQLAMTTFCCSFLAPNAFYYIKKEQNNCSKSSALASSEAFPSIFTFSLLTGSARMFLAPRGQRVP